MSTGGSFGLDASRVLTGGNVRARFDDEAICVGYGEIGKADNGQYPTLLLEASCA